MESTAILQNAKYFLHFVSFAILVLYATCCGYWPQVWISSELEIFCVLDIFFVLGYVCSIKSVLCSLSVSVYLG